MLSPDSFSKPQILPQPTMVNTVGRPKTVTEPYLERLRELVSHDPRQFGYPFRRWTARWLNQHLSQEYGVSVSDRHINRLLKQMGLSTRTAYATSPQDCFQSTSRITIGDLPPIESNPDSNRLKETLSPTAISS